MIKGGLLMDVEFIDVSSAKLRFLKDFKAAVEPIMLNGSQTNLLTPKDLDMLVEGGNCDLTN